MKKFFVQVRKNGEWEIVEFRDNLESIAKFSLRAAIAQSLFGAGEIIVELSEEQFKGLYDILRYLSKEDIGTMAIYGPAFVGGYTPRPVEYYEESVSATASQLLKADVAPLRAMAIAIAQHLGDRYAPQGETFGRGTIAAFFITQWLRNMKWAEIDVRFVAAVVYGSQWGPVVPLSVKKEILKEFLPYRNPKKIAQEVFRAIEAIG